MKKHRHLIDRSIERIPSVPNAPEPDRIVRAGALATLFGGIDYAILPNLFHISRAGTADEFSALCAAAVGALIGSISSVRHLCDERREDIEQRRFNTFKGGGIGLFSGLGVALKTSAPLLSFLDMGITAGLGLAGAGGLVVYNHLKRAKYCTNFQCQKKGKCSQKVCRFCYRLFIPKEGEINCSQTLTLDWYSIATFLQKQGLSYLDSEIVVRDNLSEWGPLPDGDGLKVDCESFLQWAYDHKAELLAYKGTGARGRSSEEIVSYLERQGV